MSVNGATDLVLPLLYALFLWWFTTGLIVAVYRSSRRTARVAFGVGTVLALAAVYGLAVTAQGTDAGRVYSNVTCGIVIWGWVVAGYYLGVITGPRVILPPGIAASPQANGIDAGKTLPLSRRFWLALQGSLYHELLALGIAVILVRLTWQAPNRWGLWMFIALWLMHSSAKLNIFFGVRNFRVDFLPGHLHYVQQLLGRRKSNLLLPVSVCLAVSVTLALVYRAIEPGAETANMIGALLVATMLLLGIVEHLLLVAPLPVTLFGWGVRSLSAKSEFENAAAHDNGPLLNERLEMTGQERPRTLPLPAFRKQQWESYRA
jgi:putative photosynthetic complex assembly protein 2